MEPVIPPAPIDCSYVLHTLRCIGAAGTERVAVASGLNSDEVERCLHVLAENVLVDLAPGPFGGWSLTDAGRVADDEWLSRELDGRGAREQVGDLYRQFLILNPELLQICSDWQMRRIGSSPTLNDHTDVDYDSRVLSRLFRLDGEAQVLCSGLADALERFGPYRVRLSSALDHVIAGNHAFLADGLESYHTIWFQLHEDLLTTLGISRDEERAAGGG